MSNLKYLVYKFTFLTFRCDMTPDTLDQMGHYTEVNVRKKKSMYLVQSWC